MSLPVDVSLFVHLKSPCLDDFRGHGQIAIWQNHPVKSNLQIALPDKMPRLFFCFEMPTQHAASGKQYSAKLLLRAQMAQHRVSHGSRGRGEVWFIHRTLQKCSGRYQEVLLSTDSTRRHENSYRD